MSDDTFEALVEQNERGLRINLIGTVNRAAKELMEDAYNEAAKREGEIVLDFTQVEYINSTGIAVIVGVLGKARTEGRDIGAMGLSSHYREVFEITRLSDFMNIYDNAPTG